MTVRDLINKRYPLLVARAKTSRTAAVHLNCLECVGGSAHEVAKCHLTECPMWNFRSVGATAAFNRLQLAEGTGGPPEDVAELALSSGGTSDA